MPSLPQLTSIAVSLMIASQPFPALAQPSNIAATPEPQKSALAPANARILHLLNRFTFGPTPADIAAAPATGTEASINNWINTWFELQLHPDRVPDPQIEARLAEFPALSLPVDQLLYRFPSGAEIRQAAKYRRPIPNDPMLNLIYHRHIALYEEKQTEKAQVQPPAMAPSTNMASASPAKFQEPGTTTPASDTAAARPSYADLLVKQILALPPAERVDHILTMHLDEYDQLKTALKPALRTQMLQDLTIQQRELLLDYENPTRAIVEELQSQRLLRDIYSTRQLQEVMTTFWLNHFNIYLHKNEQTPYYLVSYERDVIRPRALGNFEDLLVATATSPAMLLYLDNATSTGPNSPAAEKQKMRVAQNKSPKTARATPPGLNENYARELMELHTLGVNGGYNQKDVTEVAKVLTGWTIGSPLQKLGSGGDFRFDETRHEPGTKLVLGKKIKENGQREGLQLLHTLATSPATAHFISQELAVAFVSDNPPPALVTRMAQTFLRTHGDIPSVLRTLIHSQEFWAPSNMQSKVKTPLEYVISGARATGADVQNPLPIINALNQMGMPLYSCIPPTGYSAKADEWVSTGALVTRMNFSLSLATNHYPGITSNLPNADSQLTNAAASELALERQLIPTGISEKTRTAILSQMAPGPSGNLPVSSTTAKPPNPATQAKQAAQQNAQLAGLILGSPEFQRR